jgi:hypothetical protein
VAQPSFVWTNAITIKAPAGEIWPWLVQLGQGRGGLYSYDWLENLIGCDVHGADRILPAFQTPLQLGDRVIRMARYAPCAPVAVFQPQRALVLGPHQGHLRQHKMMVGIKQRAERNSSSLAGTATGPPRPRPLPEQRDLVMNGSSRQHREAN